MPRTIYINKYLPVAILYFFFNSAFLPLGLLYTTLLAPVFLLWLITRNQPTYLGPYLAITLVFACVHFFKGVDPAYYLQSYLIQLGIFIFLVAARTMLSKTVTLRVLFKYLLLANAGLTVIALFLLAFPDLKGIMWYNNAITNGVNDVWRLKMFTYEASYYSTLLAPLALYYCLRAFVLRPLQRWLAFFLIMVPVALSLSFGVILGLMLAIVAVYVSDLRLLTESRKAIGYILLSAAALAFGIMILYKIDPGNVLFKRIANVFEGHDSSFKGRTTDSFYIAWRIAQQKSLLFGCGPGQIKVLGIDILRKLYQSDTYTSANTSIPNAAAETLAVYGLIGVATRFAIEFYLFFRTRVYRNYYRLSLFVFVFFLQLTGSFITNVAEYVIWILAFTPGLFPEFDRNPEVRAVSP